MKNFVSLLLIAAIALMVNLLSKQFFFRWDFTKDKRYTLSEATRNMLGNLEDPVFVKAYFTKELDVNFARGREEFRDLLNEFTNVSKGMVDFEFTDPASDPETEQKVQQAGIPPVQMQERKDDNVNLKKGYLGAVIELGELSEPIPVVQSGMPLEYLLTTSIMKMANQDKPSVGMLTGYGGLTQEQIPAVIEQLGILYTVENVDLNSFTEELTPLRFKSLALMSPKDSIPLEHLSKLSKYLLDGGGLLVGVDAVKGDLQQRQGTVTATRVETWLEQHGVKIEPAFVIDESCGSVTVQQGQGFFGRSRIPYPLLPIAKSFAEHPITDGLEAVILPFASPLQSTGDADYSYTPIMFSTEIAGTIPAPTQLQVVNKQWGAADFPLSDIHLGAVVEHSNGGRLVVYGDGEFAAQAGAQGGDNASLMTNSLDWLSDDTGLIKLRTRGVSFNPLDEIEDDRRKFLKWMNFLLPIVLVLFYGFFRNGQNKSRRLQRMQDDYRSNA